MTFCLEHFPLPKSHPVWSLQDLIVMMVKLMAGWGDYGSVEVWGAFGFGMQPARTLWHRHTVLWQPGVLGLWLLLQKKESRPSMHTSIMATLSLLWLLRPWVLAIGPKFLVFKELGRRIRQQTGEAKSFPPISCNVRLWQCREGTRLLF